MNVAIITGSCGLIGCESVFFFCQEFDLVIGIDNDMRSYYFGKEASTKKNKKRLQEQITNYKHIEIDIRDIPKIKNLFKKYNYDIKLIIHTAAQPSHDWASKEPLTDFSVNANGTLNLLECTRNYCPKSIFIFTSTNKVYGDLVNKLPLIEGDKRFELDSSHKYYKNGIDETMSIDQSNHSIFGASKVAADILVQEYGKYFKMKTGVFRGGCLTGPLHTGAELHGFLAYLVFCALTRKEYTVFGYHGKQVRDNIHSKDLVKMFFHYYKNPQYGEVFNVGGGRFSNCSILEVIDIIKSTLNKKVLWKYSSNNRSGDHIWWISDVNKFKYQYGDWDYTITLEKMILDIATSIEDRIL